VGACNAQNQPAWFTNFGCDVFVPGDGISTISVFSDTSTNTISGTSFSSPYYAGLLACLIEGSDKFNTWQQSTSFTYRMMTQVMDDTVRIGYFANQNKSTRTANSRGLGGVYYHNPSLEFTDQEVADYLAANASNLQGIADAAKEFNVSASRMARCASIAQGVEVTVAGLNEHFAANGVVPWWAS
jgi:subtilisin family serine protease